MQTCFDCKILVVEDEREVALMIQKHLQKEGYGLVYTAGSFKEAMDVFGRENPDCMVLDINLPDGDGFSLMKKIRVSSQAPIRFLSARDKDEDRLLGLGLGADDYIVKPFLPRELSLRLGSILNRAYFFSKSENEAKPIFSLGRVTIDLTSGAVIKDGIRTELKAKEYALLEKLYANRNKIVTFDSLCEAVWGDRYYGYENTLMVHIRRLREKIEEEPSHPRYLLTIKGLGYKLEVSA